MNKRYIFSIPKFENLIVWIAACIALSTFAMCKKDLGNYDYSDLPELSIDTAGLPAVYTVKKNIEQLVITPKVVYQGDNTLEYYWIRSRAANFGMKDDTISRERELRMNIDFPTTNTASVQNAYSLFFRVKEVETGRSEFVEFKLFVTGLFGGGLFVAHEKEGSADFDFIETPRGSVSPVIRNVYSSANDERLPGRVVHIGPSGGTRAIFFATDQQARLLEYDGMASVMSGNDLFGDLNHPESFLPESFISNYFFNNGVIYWSGYGFPMAVRYGMADGTSYRASPNNSHTALAYDELNGRFLTVVNGGQLVPFPDAEPSARFSLNNIGKRLLFMATGFTLASSWAQFTSYAVFEDRTQADKRSLYIFNHHEPLHPDYAMIDISHVAGIEKAFSFQTISSVPVIYYVTPENVSLLQINPAGNSVVEAGAQFSAPPGEVITAFFKENDTYCYIATFEEASGKGKVYLFRRATGTGLFDATPLKVWTDFDGRVISMELKRS